MLLLSLAPLSSVSPIWSFCVLHRSSSFSCSSHSSIFFWCLGEPYCTQKPDDAVTLTCRNEVTKHSILLSILFIMYMLQQHISPCFHTQFQIEGYFSKLRNQLLVIIVSETLWTETKISHQKPALRTGCREIKSAWLKKLVTLSSRFMWTIK